MSCVFGVKMDGVTMMVTIECLGGSLGWGVNIAGRRYLIFRRQNEIMEASYYKLPEWLTADEIDILRDIVTEIERARFGPKIK